MLIHVKVEAESKTDEILKKRETSYLVKVKAPRERNEANMSLLRLLAQYFAVPSNKVRIITGHHMPSKIVEIETHQSRE
jgi:uncharacterized protein (TIGR00251 family)